VNRTLLAVAIALLGCSDPAPPVAPQTPVVEPSAEPRVEPVAAPEVLPASTANAELRIPPLLLAQLESVDTIERGEVSATACQGGCALLSPGGQLTLALLQTEGESEGYPEAVNIVRIDGAEHTLRAHRFSYTPESIAAYEDTEGAAPWMATLTRALGNIRTHRWAENIITHRATTSFSLEDVSVLVALGGPLAGRVVYVETGETAYRIHLAQRDGSRARLLAKLPIQPSACNGDYTDRACVLPISLDAVYASPDGRFLNVVYHEAVAGDFPVRQTSNQHPTGNPQHITLALDDASALPSLITSQSRREDLVRSLSAPGPAARVWSYQSEDSSRGGQCDHGCGLFFENNEMWFVRPSRVAQGEPRAPMIFRPDGASAEVLISAGDDAETRAAAIERGLTGAPRVQGRRIIARQANAAWEGVIHVPLVELRAPHVGAQLSLEVEGEAYVIRMRRGDNEVELGRLPALHVNGQVSPPTLVEVFVPAVLGSPITVLGAAPTRLPSHEDGVEHTYFHGSFPLP